MGGLGIKDLRSKNKAYLMKLCWGILTKPEALWVCCLKSKYQCTNDPYPAVYAKSNASIVWRGIASVCDLFYKGVGRGLISGNTSSFWWDLWSPLDKPLTNSSIED